MQNIRLNDTTKQEIVNQYFAGTPVAALCAQNGIPRSTLYAWIHRFSPLKTASEKTVSYQEYTNLKRRFDKLEKQLEVIRLAGCGTSAPLKEKLTALEKLYGQFSVHVLCYALNVSRGTFYNHVFHRKKTPWYDTRREDLRVQVRTIFDENKQRFGSQKISAILAERGIKSSPKYVAELMREMGLYCIGRNAKREYKKQTNLRGRPNVL